MTADDSFHRLDDDYPAYTMGRAAEMLNTTQGFPRAIGEARLITPLRSPGGHRRYSRYQLRIAARARELVDAGTPIDAACRIRPASPAAI
ncbi:MerR family transcriptional regulator [Streptomyces sp. C3-3]|nr:MerR family transcriptional regulator [Streptomyces sp. C3-3]